ncbi:MAG: hypothetical protein ABIV21_04275 [Pyrinomonadaceae bacterium]
MAKRIINNHSNRKIDRRKRSDAATAGINYISDALSTRGPNLTNNLSVDDVILSLANAYENRRARQATEWERMRQQNFLRTM